MYQVCDAREETSDVLDGVVTIAKLPGYFHPEKMLKQTLRCGKFPRFISNSHRCTLVN